jgi:CubicO group peptidase (beta-lactamase class C family)
MDLMEYADQYLFNPIDGEVAHWSADSDGYRMGNGELHVTARSMAKFGQLYLDGGTYEGTQIVPSDYVDASLQRYTTGINITGWIDGLSSRYGSFRDIGYGYQWWSGRSGDHSFFYALGHGGNCIILLHDLDMVIVTTADPLHDLWGGNSWRYEGAINEMLGKFIASLPEAR